ncbi:F-box domain containing protein, partial [Trema orientale]
MTCFFDIPDKIIVEILLRLDIKSIIRFKCVSKSSKSLIGHDPRLKRKVPYIMFGKRQEDDPRPCPHEKLFSYGHFSNFRMPVLRRLPLVESGSDSLIVEGSDNGVLCLSEFRTSIVYLWNPTTRELKKLPSPNCPNTQFRFGFGYDSLTNDFKVIMISSPFGIIVNPTPMGMYKLRLLRCCEWICPLALIGLLVAFNLNTEIFKLMESPQQHITRDSEQSIGKLSEYLSSMTRRTPGLIEIWVMKEYGISDSWIKQVKVDLTKCSINSPPDIKLSPFQSFSLQWSSFLHPYKDFYPIAFGNNGYVLICSDSY